MIKTALTKKQVLKIVDWELMEITANGIEELSNSEIEDLYIKIEAQVQNLKDVIK